VAGTGGGGKGGGVLLRRGVWFLTGGWGARYGGGNRGKGGGVGGGVLGGGGWCVVWGFHRCIEKSERENKNQKSATTKSTHTSQLFVLFWKKKVWSLNKGGGGGDGG